MRIAENSRGALSRAAKFNDNANEASRKMGAAMSKTVPVRVTIDRSRSVELSRRALLRGLAAGSVVALAGCAENMALGRSQLILVSDDQLAALSLTSWQQLKSKERVSTNKAYTAQLARVGPRVAAVSGLSGQAWEYTVFESSEVNAFVLPGGKVGFYSGIMKLFDNDDQCAVVMGHETGHVVGRHAAERYSQSTLANTGLSVVSATLSRGDSQFSGELANVLGMGVTYGVILPFSRRDELEADRLGITMMRSAGFNPTQAIPFWQKMAAQGGARPPQFMSTHPDPATRIIAIKQQLQGMGYKV